jgi:HSP20 family molecular chaperone IbpA
MAAKDISLAGMPADYTGGVLEVAPEELEQRRAALLEAIAQRAYELYEQRGGQHGYHLEDWLQAEREMTRSLSWTLVEEADGFRLIAEVPGFAPDQIRLFACDNLLMLEAHATADSRLAQLGHAQIGRDILQFIPIPEGVSASRATLDVEHGILQVQLPVGKRPPRSVTETEPAAAGRSRREAGRATPEASAGTAPPRTTRKRTKPKQ